MQELMSMEKMLVLKPEQKCPLFEFWPAAADLCSWGSTISRRLVGADGTIKAVAE
jgi:hypothetical protein